MRIAFPVVTAETAEYNPLLPAPYDILWSSVVFAIVLVFFMWVVPKVNTALDARAEAIEGGLKRAEEAQAAATAALEQQDAQLAEARAEAAQIRERARGEGQQILAELKAQAQAEADRIAAQAQQQIEAERVSAMQSLKHEVGTLALDLSEKVVGESITDERASAIVDRFLADIEREGAGRS